MALTYTYSDTYIINSIDIEEHETAETKALTDLGKQGVTDTFYLEEMCKALVYIDLGTKQLEAEGMSDRVSSYRKEYLRYSQMDNFDDADGGVVSGTIGRA